MYVINGVMMFRVGKDKEISFKEAQEQILLSQHRQSLALHPNSTTPKVQPKDEPKNGWYHIV